MAIYKRNQVEEAISRTLGERKKAPSAELLARIKRLLDTDRTEKSGPVKRAFVSGTAEGQGHENKFSSYDAFAILLGASDAFYGLVANPSCENLEARSARA